MADISADHLEKDNITTYEHFCDTHADMEQIDEKYITLGSVCIVLEDET